VELNLKYRNQKSKEKEGTIVAKNVTIKTEQIGSVEKIVPRG
jgi:hypothetical protein